MTDEATQAVHVSGAASFAAMGATAGGVELVWARDGRGPPTPGAPGDLLAVGEDAFACFYRARGQGGATFVAEIERDAPDPAAFPAAWGPLTNSVLAAIWKRRAVAAMAEADARAPMSVGFDEHRPLWICREKSVMFEPPAPNSAVLGRLDTCRDEEVLRAAGLPSWSSGATRFVRDPADPSSGSPEWFYTSERSRPKSAVARVGGPDEFVKNLAHVLDPVRANDPARRILGPRFPCVKCDQLARCYPPAEPGVPQRPFLALRRLAPVALHPFRAVLRREEVLRFDEHVDLLGGVPWQAFRGRHGGKWAHTGTRIEREALERTAFSRAGAVGPMAAVAAKLALFEAVTAEVARFHRAHGRPHLGLGPETLLSHTLFPPPGGLPEVSLRGSLLGAMLEDLMSPPPGTRICLPPPGAAEPYAHVDVARAAAVRSVLPADAAALHEGGFRFGLPTAVRVTTSRLWEDPAQGGAVECELDASGVGFDAANLDPTDRVRIDVSRPGWQGTTLWCRPDAERSAASARPLRLYPMRLTSAQILDLKGAGQGQALFGSLVAYRSYGAFYDLHALGMLLVRAMLENSRHDLSRIASDVLPSLKAFTNAVRGRGDKPRWDEVVDLLENVAKTPPLDAFVAQANSCFLAGEIVDPAQRVPPRIWAEILATALACITRHEGVSFCTGTRLEEDRDRFCAPVERLLAKIRELRRSLGAGVRAAAPQPVPEAAPAFDPDADKKRLAGTAVSQAARIERLEAEIASLLREKASLDRSHTGGVEGEHAAAAWRRLVEAVLGGPAGNLPVASRDAPAVELLAVVLSESLETIAALSRAMAEIGGEELAGSTQSVQRLVRLAMRAAADDPQESKKSVKAAIDGIRAARQVVGRSLGTLVDAHNASTRHGTRKLLATLHVALNKELELKPAQVKQVESIVARLNSNLPEMIAMLYDPAFTAHVRRHVEGGDRGGRQEP